MLNLVFSTTGFPSELLTIDTCITSADASEIRSAVFTKASLVRSRLALRIRLADRDASHFIHGGTSSHCTHQHMQSSIYRNWMAERSAHDSLRDCGHSVQCVCCQQASTSRGHCRVSPSLWLLCFHRYLLGMYPLSLVGLATTKYSR